MCIIYAYIYIYIHICIYVYIYIYIERERCIRKHGFQVNMPDQANAPGGMRGRIPSISHSDCKSLWDQGLD